ncbi:MAG: ATP-binding protein [Candidatus Promineifilaceae bacterium]
MNLKPLPIGIQTFRDIIHGGFLYVDKTRWIYELIRYPKGVYFLARPRRFGKSLLISTLDEIFQGQRELFRGLWLYDSPYAWQSHPVIRLDFSRYPSRSADELEGNISVMLNRLAEGFQLEPVRGNFGQQFESLIIQLSRQQQVVILVDEYDKPLLDNLENQAEAVRIRDLLRGFYTVIKSMDAHIRFVFLTGVSKFSRVGVFSGLNNLNDISLDREYAGMLGITPDELEAFLQPYLPAFAQQEGVDEVTLLSKIQSWYNGFCFSSDCQAVYNPFSLLLLLQKQAFRNYWFESGTPAFLIRLIRQRDYRIEDLSPLTVPELAFSSYEVEDLQIVPLLFQTGYLTIKGYDPEFGTYTLGYPNYEVENAFTQHLLGAFIEIEHSLAGSYLWQLVQALQAGNLARFFEVLQLFFAGIPYDIQIKRERYYQTIFYLIFKLMGVQIEAETRISRGRVDAVIQLKQAVYLFEFKLDGSAAEALQQIRQRGYYKPYQAQSQSVFLVGVNFTTEKGEITDWLSEQA